MSSQKSNGRWYPSEQQLKDPKFTRNALKQVLDLHYALSDKVDAMTPAPSPTAPAKPTGPAAQQFLGMPVAPINTQDLTDGATLKWSKANGHFTFS